MHMHFGVGFMELIMMFVMSLPLGLPPGERDAKLMNCPPANTIFYAEAAPLGPGNISKPGWDSFLEDEEIKLFLKDFDSTLNRVADKIKEDLGQEGDNSETTSVIKLVKILPRCAQNLYIFPSPANTASSEQKIPAWANLLQAGLVVNGSDQAEEIEKAVLKLLQRCRDIYEPAGWENLDISEMKELKLPLMGEEGPHVIFHKSGNYMMACYGEQAFEHAKKGLAGEAQGYAGSDSYTQKIKPLLYSRNAQIVQLDIKGLLQALTKVAPEQSQIVNTSMALLGLQGLEGLSITTGLVEGQLQAKTVLWNKGELTNGLLTLLKGPGLKSTDFAHIPADADFVAGYSFDAELIFKSISQLVAAADQNSAETMNKNIKGIEELFNLSITEDLLPALGHSLMVHDAPSQGGALITAPVFRLSLKKPEVIEKFMDSLCKIIETENESRTPNEYYLREFMGHKIYNMGYDDDDFMIHLSWTFTKDEMYLALHPSTLKSQLRLLASNDQAKLSIPVQQFIKDDSAMITCMYYDIKASMHAVYSFIPYLLTSLNNEAYRDIREEGFDIKENISIFSLPSMTTLKKYETVNWNVTRVEQNNIKFESQTSVTTSILPLIISGSIFLFEMH